MRNSVALIWFVGVLTLGVAAVGQDRPNFSGRWVQISPSDGVGTEQTIKHDGDRMSTGHDSEGGGHALNYRLDGVESRNVITSHGADIVSKTRAAWEGQKLVIRNTTDYPDGRTVSDKQSWSLDENGQLRIEIARSMPGREPMSFTVVFSKRPRP